MMTHVCPYGGRVNGIDLIFDCGQSGRLCDRCKEDGANARNAELLKALLEICRMLMCSKDIDPERFRKVFEGKADL